MARSVRLALAGELVPDAVNVQGGAIAEDVRPALPLTEKLGRIFTGLAGELPAALTVEVRGEIAEHDVSILELSALKGVFTDVVEDAGVLRQRPLVRQGARRRGLARHQPREPRPPQPRHGARRPGVRRDSVGLRHAARGAAADREGRRGRRLRHRPRPHRPHGVLRYDDRPGVVGVVGRILGDAGVNIAGMQVAADAKGGQALVALTVDSAIAAETLAAIAGEIGAESAAPSTSSTEPFGQRSAGRWAGRTTADTVVGCWRRTGESAPRQRSHAAPRKADHDPAPSPSRRRNRRCCPRATHGNSGGVRVWNLAVGRRRPPHHPAPAGAADRRCRPRPAAAARRQRARVGDARARHQPRRAGLPKCAPDRPGSSEGREPRGHRRRRGGPGAGLRPVQRARHPRPRALPRQRALLRHRRRHHRLEALRVSPGCRASRPSTASCPRLRPTRRRSP